MGCNRLRSTDLIHILSSWAPGKTNVSPLRNTLDRPARQCSTKPPQSTGGMTKNWHSFSFTTSTQVSHVYVWKMQLPGESLGRWPDTSISLKEISSRQQDQAWANSYQPQIWSISVRIAFLFFSTASDLCHSRKDMIGITYNSDDCQHPLYA